MYTPNLTYICLFILSSFFVFEFYHYCFRIVPILIDKSYGDETENTSKLNRKKAVLRTWFIGFFLSAFGYSLLTIKSTENKYLILFYFIAGFILMFLFHYIPRKIENNSMYFKDIVKNIENLTSIGKVKHELKPSTLNADERKEQFKSALEKKYFAPETTFSQFEDLLNLQKPTEKIIWKPLFSKKKKNRRLLQEFLNNNLFQDQLILNNLLTTKEMCEFVNTYFDFNEEVHKEFENPLNTDNVRDWRNHSIGIKKDKA